VPLTNKKKYVMKQEEKEYKTTYMKRPEYGSTGLLTRRQKQSTPFGAA